MSDPAEVTVLVHEGRHLLHSLACGLGLHATRVEAVPGSVPGCIHYCPRCGETADRRWVWKYTTYRWDLGDFVFVTYRAEGSA